MTEDEFWSLLEGRVCREMAESSKKLWRVLSCDGFCPGGVVRKGKVDWFVGIVWTIAQERYDFRLRLGPSGSGKHIEWDSLLPPEDATGWLRVDKGRRLMEILPPEGGWPVAR